jgi:VanZ family protein
MSGPRRLSIYLAAAWTALVVYASLYPFAGWHDTGADPLAFLLAAWPRYFTGFDLATNVAAYVPLGFFACVALRRQLSATPAVVIATLGGMFLSGSLEFLQNYLPSRVASNLDIACNGGGALIGALAAAYWGGFMLEHGRLVRLSERLLAARRGVDSGLILLGLWLVSQLDPAVIAFGTGDLRHLLELPAAQPFAAASFRNFEAALGTTGLLAALMVASLIAAPRQRRLLPLLLLAALLFLKILVFALLWGPAAAFDWATPGTLGGLGIGTLLWFGASYLVVPLQRALAALSLLLATAIINLGPSNPYLEHALQIWNPGHFLNFHGLTEFAAALWPFLALPWLMLIPTRDER